MRTEVDAAGDALSAAHINTTDMDRVLPLLTSAVRKQPTFFAYFFLLLLCTAQA
jgi:hypothetical protein